MFNLWKGPKFESDILHVIVGFLIILLRPFGSIFGGHLLGTLNLAPFSLGCRICGMYAQD